MDVVEGFVEGRQQCRAEIRDRDRLGTGAGAVHISCSCTVGILVGRSVHLDQDTHPRGQFTSSFRRRLPRNRDVVVHPATGS